jgi:purine-binding chemotaxis protein CheW
MQYLTWEIDNQLYAADIEYCVEVQKDIKIVSVPHSKNYIVGIMNLRGDIVTVIDLLTFIGMNSENHLERPIIIRLKNQLKQVAILVDSVTEVMEISDEYIEDSIKHLSQHEAKFISKVANTKSGFIMILNLEQFFNIK